MAYIPGYLATITVGSSTVNVNSSDASLSLTNETLDKTTLGVTNRQYIPGLQDGTLDATMHLDTGDIVNVQAAYASTLPVAFVFRPGALGTHDAGEWGGKAIITDMSVDGAVDDNWSVSISCQITGPVVYTAPV